MFEVEHIDFISVPTREHPSGRRCSTARRLGCHTRGTRPAAPSIARGQVTLGIWNPEANGSPFAANPAGFALRVADVAAARTHLEGAGVGFDMETIDTGVCHMALFHDPDGNRLILHHRYAQ